MRATYLTVLDRHGVVSQDGLDLVALLRLREDLRAIQSVESRRRWRTGRAYLLLRAELVQHPARLPLLRHDVQEPIARHEDDHARGHDVRKVQQDLAELRDLPVAHSDTSTHAFSEEWDTGKHTKESSPRCWNLNVSSPPRGPFFKTSAWRFDVGMMCPQEKVVRRDGGRLAKSWFTTSDIWVRMARVSSSKRKGTENTYWRHGPAREDDRACGLDDLLEVRRGIQVLVLDFHRAIDEAEADSSVCSRIYHLGLRTRLLREHTRMKTYRRWTR